MKMLKRTWLIMCLLICMGFLVACDSESTTASTQTQTAQSTTQPEIIIEEVENTEETNENIEDELIEEAVGEIEIQENPIDIETTSTGEIVAKVIEIQDEQNYVLDIMTPISDDVPAVEHLTFIPDDYIENGTVCSLYIEPDFKNLFSVTNQIMHNADSIDIEIGDTLIILPGSEETTKDESDLEEAVEVIIDADIKDPVQIIIYPEHVDDQNLDDTNTIEEGEVEETDTQIENDSDLNDDSSDTIDEENTEESDNE